MGVQLLKNNCATTLAAPCSDVATEITLTDITGFPSPSGGDWFLLTLYQLSGVTETNYEILKVMAVTPGAGVTGVCTVVREYEDAARFPKKSYTAGDFAEIRDTAGTKRVASQIINVPAGSIAATDVQAAINELDTEKAALAGATFTGAVNLTKGADIASAATINLTTATGNLVHVTGTAAITAVTLASGYKRTVIFDGALTLTHHATNNNLPGAANITTTAGARAEYEGDGSTVRCVAFIQASGDAIINGVRVGKGTGTGTNNTAMGLSALVNNISGAGNTAVGSQSLDMLMAGDNNTAVGVAAIPNAVASANNVALGYFAGSNSTGSDNTFLGASSSALAAGNNNTIVIGKGAVGAGSDTVVIGNASITNTYLKGVVTVPSLVGTDTTDATSSTAAAVKTAGGLAVAKKIYAGDAITATGFKIGAGHDAATAWTAYTPTVTAASGTITTASATGAYKQIGKTVHFRIVVTITTNGTGAVGVRATLPSTAIAANAFSGTGIETAVTGNLLTWFLVSTTAAQIYKYDGAYPGGSGYVLNISGTYEAA